MVHYVIISDKEEKSFKWLVTRKEVISTELKISGVVKQGAKTPTAERLY